MVQPFYKASAPGNLILTGEYSVLYNYPCIVLAINRLLTVKLHPKKNKDITIDSTLGQHRTTLDNIVITSPFEYVLTTLKSRKILPTGFHLEIISDIPVHLGLGSSAAVTVALLRAIHQWQGIHISQKKFFQQALAIIHQVQGKGSGADLAASMTGGIIKFVKNPFCITPLIPRPLFVVIYSGHKTTTTTALKILDAKLKNEKIFIDKIIQTLGNLSIKSVTAFINNDWHLLGKLMNETQKTLKLLGVSNDSIDSMIENLTKDRSIYGVKLSGSGIGDCIIALGSLTKNTLGDNLLPLCICDHGAMTC